MKFFLIGLVALGSISALASENREVICNVPYKVDSDFALVTASSCADYVEYSPGSFIVNPEACLSAITSHTLKYKNGSLKALTIKLAASKKMMCFIGIIENHSFVVEKIIKREALNVVQY